MELKMLLAGLQPVLNAGRYAFVTLPSDYSSATSTFVVTVREAEGMSVILPEQDAIALGLPIAFCAAWITLTVNSDLAAVGLTAAFATALAQAGISCNVVAGVCHDHLFVAVAQAEQAMGVLLSLQQSAA
jgi:hypothetical protein